MSEIIKQNATETGKNRVDNFNELEEYGKEHPFDRQKAEQLLEGLKRRKDMMSGNLAFADYVSDLRQSEPIKQGVRMEVAKIEAAAEEGLPDFADENELARHTNRYDLIEKKREDAIATQHNLEDRKHELLMSTEDMETPNGMSMKGASDDIITNAVWKLQMEANTTSNPDKAMEALDKIQQLRSMRTKLASGVVDNAIDSIDKAQEMQDKVQSSTVKGIKALEAPSLEETRENQVELEESQQKVNGTISNIDQQISGLEQKIQEDKNNESDSGIGEA